MSTARFYKGITSLKFPIKIEGISIFHKRKTHKHGMLDFTTTLKDGAHLSFSRSVSTSSQLPREKSYDAVIVGGGHNGLVAAAYLAKSGLK